MPCECCGETRTEKTKYRNVMGTGLDLERCLGCGVKYYPALDLDRARAVNDSPEARESCRRDQECGSMTNRDPAKAAEAREHTATYYRGLLAQLQSHAAPWKIESLYEVGAGSGALLRTARAAGIATYGCDPNAAGASDPTVTHETFEVAYQRIAKVIDVRSAGPFDAVAMLDMIEHTTTPGADLDRAFRILRDGGVLVLKTFFDEYHEGFEVEARSPADYQNPRHGYFGPPGHIWHFDRPVLLALIERIGFTIRNVEIDTEWGQITVWAIRPHVIDSPA